MPRGHRPNPERSVRGGTGWDWDYHPPQGDGTHDVREAHKWWRSMSDDQKLEVMIGNAQGGWRKTTKYKDKNGNWVTETIWGSGKAGW